MEDDAIGCRLKGDEEEEEEEGVDVDDVVTMAARGGAERERTAVAVL